MARCQLVVSVLWLLVLCFLGFNCESPYDPGNGDHVHYMKHKFYDTFFYEYNATTLRSFNIINMAHVTYSNVLSNADDMPELRIDLPFHFKFYGHYNNWIAISPNGFLTTHPIACGSFCNWFGDQGYRRYIAPLMTDLVTNAFQYSSIYYSVTDTNFSAHWSNVTLWADYQPTYTFDFQVTIDADGTITFYYYNIPKLPNKIPLNMSFSIQNYTLHYGLEDAAYKYQANGMYSILPYSPVTFDESHILDKHIIVFKPRDTCIDQRTCMECKDLQTDPGTDNECGWCSKAALCSDGLGREIFEYNSEEFCAPEELSFHLNEDICTDSIATVKSCSIHDHVLAKDAAQEMRLGNAHFYSGVIVGDNAADNKYRVLFDDESVGDANDNGYQEIPSAWVHPCSVVSYRFHSANVPSMCYAHCDSIQKDERAQHTARNVLVVVAIAATACLMLVAGSHCCFKLCNATNRTRVRTFRASLTDNMQNTNANTNATNTHGRNRKQQRQKKTRIEIPNQNTRKGIQLADSASDDEEFEFESADDTLNIHTQAHHTHVHNSQNSILISPAPIVSPAIIQSNIEMCTLGQHTKHHDSASLYPPDINNYNSRQMDDDTIELSFDLPSPAQRITCEGDITDTTNIR